MALKDITQKIVEDANEEAKKILEDAKIEADKIISSSKEKAKELKENILKKAEEKAISMRKRVNTLAESESRNMFLSKKREYLNKAFEETKKYLSSMPKDKKDEIFISFFTKLEEDNGIIYPAKNSTQEIESAMKKAGKNYTLGEEGDFLAGFIFEGKTTLIDFSFDSIVDKEVRSTMFSKPSNILFA